MSSSNAPLVIANDLNFSFGEGELRRQMLYGIDFVLEPGEIVIVTGPSGSGKSTFLTLVGTLRSHQEGQLDVVGNSLLGASAATINNVRQQLGFIFQYHNLLDSLTATENVLMGFAKGDKRTKSQLKEVASSTLATLGLEMRLNYKPSSLSGGQNQRVSIARALVRSPKVILADEPTASLDATTTEIVMRLFREQTKELGSSILLVTHDDRIFKQADRVVEVRDGKLRDAGATYLDHGKNQASAALTTIAHSHKLEAPAVTADPRPGTLAANRVKGALESLEKVLSDLAEIKLATTLQSLAQSLTYIASESASSLNADGCSIYLYDKDNAELFTLALSSAKDDLEGFAISTDKGFVGKCFREGAAVLEGRAADSTTLDRTIDLKSGLTTQSVACVPLSTETGDVFGIIQLVDQKADQFSTETIDGLYELRSLLAAPLHEYWLLATQVKVRLDYPARSAGTTLGP